MTKPVAPLSEEALAEIEARANAATRAPWKQSALAGMYIVADKTDFATIASVGEYNADGSIHLAFADAEANLSFIAHAREDIPALCQTLRAARAKLEKLDRVGLHNAELIDRIRLWSKCADGYPLDEHINNIATQNAALREQLAQVEKERDELRDNMQRLGRARARDLEADNHER